MDRMPPIEKIYEAYSAIADGRVYMTDHKALVRSSGGEKEYTVAWEGNTYTSSDSATYWQGYPGYPVIAVLMLQGRLPLDLQIASFFAGVNWEKLNAKYKRDYAKALSEVWRAIGKSDEERASAVAEAEKAYRQIGELDIVLKRSRPVPPKQEQEVGTKKVWYCDSPIGTLGIAEDGRGITDLFLKKGNTPAGFLESETPLLQKAAGQLREYFEGKRRSFDLPLSLYGTDFQLAVWKALQAIPYGETRSYKQVSETVGNPKACRAVGMANNKNPVLIVIPCHRVVGADGGLVGYACGLEVKEFLLDLEKESLTHDE